MKNKDINDEKLINNEIKSSDTQIEGDFINNSKYDEKVLKVSLGDLLAHSKKLKKK